MIFIIIVAALIGGLAAWSGISILYEGCAEVTFDGNRVGGRGFVLQPVCLDASIPTVTSFSGTLVGWFLLILGVAFLLPLLVLMWENARSKPQNQKRSPNPYVVEAMNLLSDKSIDKMSRLYIRTAYKGLTEFRTTDAKPVEYWKSAIPYVKDKHLDGRRVVWTKYKRKFKTMSDEQRADFEWLWLGYLGQITNVPTEEIAELLDEQSRQQLGVDK